LAEHLATNERSGGPEADALRYGHGVSTLRLPAREPRRPDQDGPASDMAQARAPEPRSPEARGRTALPGFLLANGVLGLLAVPSEAQWRRAC